MKNGNWLKNVWIGKATLTGLKDAMRDLEYSWGATATDSTEQNEEATHTQDDHTVKLAA